MWTQPTVEELMGGCASEGCFWPATWRLDVGGVGSQFCSVCHNAKMRPSKDPADGLRRKAMAGEIPKQRK